MESSCYMHLDRYIIMIIVDEINRTNVLVSLGAMSVEQLTFSIICDTS